jgi:hypothetical protein
MRRHWLFLSVVLAGAAVGCTEPMPVDSVTVLSPGQDMRLTVRAEMQMFGSFVVKGIVTMNTDGSTTCTEKADPPSTSTMWIDMDLPLSVIAIPNSDSLRATMKFHRFRGGGSYAENGQEKHHEEYDGFEVGDESQSEGGSVKFLRDSEFVGVIDAMGQLVSTEATGKYWTDLKRELTEAAKQQGAPQAQVDMILRGQTLGVFSALEDAMAYLVPEGLKAGQSWKVRREHVFPYRYFEFAMITGCLYTKEDTTCSVISVKPRGLHSIATIAIRGKRIPHSPEPSMPQRVKHFDLMGELEVNLNTGAVEKLRLESTARWVRPKAEGGMEVKFVQAVTLKPA